MRKIKSIYLLSLLACIACESDDPEVDCTSSDLEISLEVAASGCNTAEGAITVTASGGSGSYTYELVGNEQASTQNRFTGLSPAEYIVIVADENGCRDSTSVELLTGVSLSNDIMPIIDSDCTISSCHRLVGPPLETEENVIEIAELIQAAVASGSMPPPTEPDLTEEEVSLISCWVADGALKN